jgi:hypothetical protein
MSTLHRSFDASFKASVAAVTAVALAVMSFFLFEPRIGLAQPNVSTFTISQDIIGEISFLMPANNVGMVGALSGITGGTANGSSTFVVRSNNSGGYFVTIAFYNNGSAQAMQGIVSNSDAIRDYPSDAGQPTFLFSTASTSAVFGYTIETDNAANLATSFKDDGVGCNESSGTYTADRCWMEPTTSTFEILNTTGASPLGATSTLHFRVYVPNTPTPALVTDTYRATATLTATNK